MGSILPLQDLLNRESRSRMLYDARFGKRPECVFGVRGIILVNPGLVVFSFFLSFFYVLMIFFKHTFW